MASATLSALAGAFLSPLRDVSLEKLIGFLWDYLSSAPSPSSPYEAEKQQQLKDSLEALEDAKLTVRLMQSRIMKLFEKHKQNERVVGLHNKLKDVGYDIQDLKSEMEYMELERKVEEINNADTTTSRFSGKRLFPFRLPTAFLSKKKRCLPASSQSSSLSTAAEDEPLPGIDGLQFAGEPFPGRELQACGYSINGTTSCNFEWVRYLENGAPKYIEGAKQPKYLVTADDVDTVLAIEVQPLDNRKRKGEVVTVLANDGRRITGDAELKDQVERAYRAFHASFEVLISAGALDIWEPATLAIKRDGYSIKCNGSRGVVVEEKFQPAVAITIPFGQANEFAISSTGGEYLLRAAETGVSRDTIVLTIRMLKMRDHVRERVDTAGVAESSGAKRRSERRKWRNKRLAGYLTPAEGGY